MIRTYRTTTAIALGALALSWLWLATGYRGSLPLSLIFLMPMLWLLWLICVAMDTQKQGWKLLSLWVLVDFAVLGLVSLLDATASKGSGPDGMDLLLIIVYSPIILPMMLVTHTIPQIGDWVLMLPNKILSGKIFGTYAQVLSAWVGCSIAAAISSLSFVVTCGLMRRLIGGPRLKDHLPRALS